jgi:signal transduction histidine kinase
MHRLLGETTGSLSGRRITELVDLFRHRLESEDVIERDDAHEAAQPDKDQTKATESNRRLGSEVDRREQAEIDRDELLATIALTAERERGRLSLELHDEVGQHLTSLLLGLQGIIDVAGVGSEVNTRAQALHSLAQRLGSELHDIAVRLRPKALDDFGIEAALRSYAQVWSRETGIEADVQTTGREDRLSEVIETTIYRIAQEALTNVSRHSGAKRVSVVLHKGDRMCRLAVEDDGKGFQPEVAGVADGESGLGLLGMAERARLAGGNIDIESSPGGGTSVFVRIPCQPASPRGIGVRT